MMVVVMVVVTMPTCLVAMVPSSMLLAVMTVWMMGAARVPRWPARIRFLRVTGGFFPFCR